MCLFRILAFRKCIHIIHLISRHIVLVDVVFQESMPFFSPFSTSASQGEEDDWVVYISTTPKDSGKQPDEGSSPTSPSSEQPTVSDPPPAKRPIFQVYSRRRETNNTCPAPTSTSCHTPQMVLIFQCLCKGKRQCTLPKFTYPIAKFV